MIYVGVVITLLAQLIIIIVGVCLVAGIISIFED